MSESGNWACGGSALPGGLSEGLLPVFMRVLKKTTKNSEWLCRQVRPGVEPGTSVLLVLSAEPLSHWWGFWKCTFTFHCQPNLIQNWVMSMFFFLLFSFCEKRSAIKIFLLQGVQYVATPLHINCHYFNEKKKKKKKN